MQVKKIIIILLIKNLNIFFLKVLMIHQNVELIVKNQPKDIIMFL